MGLRIVYAGVHIATEAGGPCDGVRHGIRHTGDMTSHMHTSSKWCSRGSASVDAITSSISSRTCQIVYRLPDAHCTYGGGFLQTTKVFKKTFSRRLFQEDGVHEVSVINAEHCGLPEAEIIL